VIKYLIGICAMGGLLLLYLLSRASANTDLFSHDLYLMLGLAGALALFMAGLVGYQLWQLRANIKAQVFGAVLTWRLALFFTLIAVLPGTLVYGMSVKFLGKSIESWFDVRVEKALEGGLNLGRSSLDNGLKELGKKGQFIALLLAEQDESQHASTLNRLIDEGAAQEAALFSPGGKLLAYATSGGDKLTPELPDAAMLAQVRNKGMVSVVDSEADNHLTLRVLVPVNPVRLSGEPRILQFMQPVPKQLSDDAETVQAVYRDYQELSLSRLGLKRMYALTLTLFLLVVLLSAVSAAFFISRRLGAPLAALAEGTRAVAQGDFSRQHPVKSSDELGMLTGMFNQMTMQLAEAKAVSERQQRQVEQARAYLESVLAHLSSGVLVVDARGLIRSVNASAAQILGVALEAMQGQTMRGIVEEHASLRAFVDAVEEGFGGAGNSNEWQRQIERLSRNGKQILLIRGTRLSADGGGAQVVVFDDITHLLRAERQAAWGEVARRLAHEIKNPLMPIQLSAERLQHKLTARLNEEDAGLLQRATQTIVSQVSAMKSMVSDFADYARAPAPKLAELDMHQLLSEVMGLYEGNSHINLQLAAQDTRIKGDATRLRQVIHNLLQNAQDALQQSERPEIRVTSSNDENWLHLAVQDNGSGFPEQLLDRAFEPYVTSKPKGTGLGLAIVKKIVEEHGGMISIENVAEGGARVSLALPLVTGAA
jgi:PAS domain S-box-containing protein